MVTALLVKNYQIKLLKKFGIFSWLKKKNKIELRSRSHTHENQELRSCSHVHEKKSSGDRAVTFLQRLRSPEIIHTVAKHINDPE